MLMTSARFELATFREEVFVLGERDDQLHHEATSTSGNYSLYLNI